MVLAKGGLLPCFQAHITRRPRSPELLPSPLVNSSLLSHPSTPLLLLTFCPKQGCWLYLTALRWHLCYFRQASPSATSLPVASRTAFVLGSVDRREDSREGDSFTKTPLVERGGHWKTNDLTFRAEVFRSLLTSTFLSLGFSLPWGSLHEAPPPIAVCQVPPSGPGTPCLAPFLGSLPCTPGACGTTVQGYFSFYPVLLKPSGHFF